jgi:hypothetical protein
MEYRDKILSLAQAQPLLPNIVAKALSTNSIMAGAMLSEMCSKGLLKTSALRVGGSPLYLIPGKEEQLLNHLQNLNEKDRRTVLKLQEEKIIREQESDPLTRVSLATVKDFAKPLTVSYDGKQETFWKWFALTDKEAEDNIRQKLEPTKIQEQQKQVQPEKPKTQEPKPAEKPIQEKIKQQEPRPVQETLAPKQTPEPNGDFWDKLHTFFTQNNIALLDKTAIKKKTDFDLTLEVPSPVGKLTYYCKARSKKKITDADISAAYVQGQIKKLPVILLTDGELTKQAHTILAQLKGITVKKV